MAVDEPGPRRSWWWIGLLLIGAVLLLENLGAGPLDRVLLYLPGIDKVLHTAQSLAILLICHALFKYVFHVQWLRVIAAVAVTLLFAVFDEVQQQFVAGRNVEARDILAGFAGLILGVAWIVRGQRPGRAAVMASAALALSAVVTVDSFYTTRDYNQGLLLERHGRFKEARDRFRQSLARGNDSADLLNYLAWTEVESGDGDVTAAVRYAERSLQLRPGDPDTLDTYGWALHHAGRSQDAVAPLLEALERKPDIYCIHYHLAATLLALDRRAEAVRHLKLQIELKPDTREAERAAVLLERLARSSDGNQ